MQFKVSMFPFHSLLQCWEISPLRLLQSWPWRGLCLTLPMLRETCHGFLLFLLFSYSYFSLRDLWWILTLGRPVVDTTYSFELMVETCGDTYSSLLYSYSLWQTYELMLETCGEHLLHWWQVYKCSPETPAVGAVRWKGNLTEHLSSVPTEFCYHHHNLGVIMT